MIHKLFSKTPVAIKVQAGPFRGAKVFLNPSNSKRKIFGLYEHVLNSWIKQKSRGKQFVLDVGANTGYDTYGFAHLLLKHKVIAPAIFAFEPEAHLFPELNDPQHWPEYRNCDIRIIPKFVGREDSDTHVTLDRIMSQNPDVLSGNGIIKIDVEGGEGDVLAGATQLLQNPAHEWLIEIHGAELIPEIANYFVEAKRPFLIKDLTPLPVFGTEKRSIVTYWLLTL